jgi:hypothetical protein
MNSQVRVAEPQRQPKACKLSLLLLSHRQSQSLEELGLLLDDCGGPRLIEVHLLVERVREQKG